MSIIELSGVSKAFGGVKANTDISMSVEKGGITGLIGPNTPNWEPKNSRRLPTRKFIPLQLILSPVCATVANWFSRFHQTLPEKRTPASTIASQIFPVFQIIRPAGEISA